MRNMCLQSCMLAKHAKWLDRHGLTHLELHLVLQPCQSHLPSSHILLGRQLLDIIYQLDVLQHATPVFNVLVTYIIIAANFVYRLSHSGWANGGVR